MKKIYYIGSIFLMLAALTINNAEAQQNSQIHRDFKQLKTHLTKIWHLVQNYNNENAKQLMAQAKEHMDSAEDYIYRRTDLTLKERIIGARNEMVKARAKGNLAAKIVLKQPVQRLKTQLDDLINRADIEFTKNYNDEVQYLISQAKKFRGRAYDALTREQIAKAQEFYRVAFFFANKALDIMHRKEGNIDSQITELRSNLQLLINQTEEIISNKDNRLFSNMLEEAKKHLSEATHMYESGKEQLALRRFRLIEKLLYRIIDQVDRKSLTVENRSENDLYSLKALLDALETEAGDITNDRVKLFLSKAQKFYREAKQAFESGKYKKAQMKISLSQRLASKILQLIKKGEEHGTFDIETKLADARRLWEIQANPVKESGNPSLQKMYSESENLLNKSQKNYESNNMETAFQLLQVAMRLTNRIQRMLEANSQEKIVQINQLKQKLERVKSLILKLKNNADLLKKYENIISQMEQLVEQAEKHLNNQNYELAEEYINSLLQQINLYTNRWSKQTE